MAASRGIQAVRTWAKNLGRDVTRVTLCAELAGTEGEVIGEWDKANGDDESLGFRDKDWPDEVAELAQQDCAARGQSLRYSVRSYVGDDTRNRSRTHLTMVAPRDKSDEDKDAHLDGSTASIIGQLQKSLETSNRQMIEMVKLEQQSKAGVNQLVTQLTTSLRDREDMISKLVDMRTAEQLEHAKELTERTVKGGTNESDAAFIEFAKQALPHALPVIMENMGPFLWKILTMLQPAPGAAATSAAASTASAAGEIVSAATNIPS